MIIGDAPLNVNYPLNVNTGVIYNTTRTEITSGGQLAVTDAATTANTGSLEVSGGAITGAGNLIVRGATTYTGGQNGGYDGGNVIANNGLSISGDSEKQLGFYYGPVYSGIVNNARRPGAVRAT